MSVRHAFERRAAVSRDLARDMALPGAMSRGKAWLLVVSGLVLTALADMALGRDIWFGPFYLLAIGFAAWTLGRWQAVGVGLAALGCILSANGTSLYPYGTIAATWNLGTRLVLVLSLIGLIDHVRRSYVREWRLARTDPLTGALNRQAFFELAASSPVSREWTMFAYADLDGLKKLNDERGHDAGDQCLRAYVDHVRTVIRKTDHFARLGGDEFIAHLRVRDEESARAVAARLHHEMNAIAARVHPGMKCSVGVLILPPGRRMFDREVTAADQLMYEAKRQGAGLAAATLREVHGRQYLLQHWRSGQDGSVGGNPVLNDQFAWLEGQAFDTAA